MPQHSANLVLVDGHDWRRESYAAGLRPLMRDGEMSLTAWNGDGDLPDVADDALVLLIVGGSPVASGAVTAQLDRLTRQFGGAVAVAADTITSECIAVALRLGLRGVLSTAVTQSVMLATVQFLLAGGTYIPHTQTLSDVPPEVAGYLPPPRTETAAPPAAQRLDHPALTRQADRLAETVRASLTRRQQEVAVALALGASNKEIARKLTLSEATVKSHVRQIMRKFDVTNRTQAALRAQAFVSPEGSRRSA